MFRTVGIVASVAAALLLLNAPVGQAFLELLLKDDFVQLFLGTSTPFYLVEEGFDSQLARSGALQNLPALEHEKGRLTFEWSAARKVKYFIHVHSGNRSIMRDPQVSIPITGTVPLGDTEFFIDFPCTGIAGGKTYLTVSFAFSDENDRPLYNEPFTLALPRQCRPGKVDHHHDGEVIASLDDKEKDRLQNNHNRPLGPHVPEDGHGAADIKNVKDSKGNRPPMVRSPVFPVSTRSLPHSELTTKPAFKVTTKPAPTKKALEECGMCQVTHNLAELKERLCKSQFVIRAKLKSHSLTSTSYRKIYLMRLTHVKKIYSSRPLVTSAIRRLQGSDKTQKEVLMRLNMGRPDTCTCGDRVKADTNEVFLVAGKFSGRRSQLMVRHSRGILIPWREVKRLVKQLRPLKC